MFLSLMMLTACGDKDPGDTATVDLFDTLVYIDVIDEETGEVIATKQVPSAGDLTCWTAGDAWLSNSADPSCIGTADFDGAVEDFESGNNVEDATVEIFHGDSANAGAADFEGVTDDSGELSGQLKTCQPFTYRVSTDAALAETVTTLQAHEIYGYRSDGTPHDAQFYSVSTSTYNVIPSLLGVTVQPGQGIAAGTAYDCNEDPIEFVQVLARDESGEIIEGQVVKYFREDFPNRDQKWTSADGLWIVINIPPGTVTVEMYGLNDAGEHDLIGTTVLEVLPDSINIANAFYGYDGGVVYPESCTSACSPDAE